MEIILPTVKRIYLGEFEELVLLMVAILGDDAYGVNLTHEIIEQTGRDVRLNQVHASLHRLEDKGMITSRMGDPTPERGGRRKRLFRISALGVQTLREIQGVRSNLWQMMPSNLHPAPGTYEA
jgi:DNA-binding PadR family transcriptional regulator